MHYPGTQYAGDELVIHEENEQLALIVESDVRKPLTMEFMTVGGS